MNKTIFPQDQTFWYLTRPPVACLRNSIKTEVVIIGGGMAGLSAAHAFAKKGKKVVLLEAYYCGAGASGKSSGFITPNSELSLTDFIDIYGKPAAMDIWKSIESGVEYIRATIKQYNIDCEYFPEDTLVVANSKQSLKKLRAEHENLAALGYKTDFITKEHIPSLLGSNEYYGGVTYADSFGINAYKYCQALKEILTQQQVIIYEETPAISIEGTKVHTLHGSVEAEHIIVCADRFIPFLGKLTKEIYHAQTFLLISQMLPESIIRMLFPGENLMVWDTDLIYTYYRIANQRLLLGGGSLLHTYDRNEAHNNTYVYNKLTTYFKKKFPEVTLQFEHFWPGLIGLSKDIAPIAGHDKYNKSIYYISAAAGLPIAAALGNYSADHIIDGRDDLKNYFSPYRSFPIGRFLQTILGTKISFALSNVIKLKVR